MLLDFRLVPRLDSTAMLSFSKMQQLGETHGLALVFTQVAPSIRRQAVVADEPGNVYRITHDALRRLDQENPAAASTFHLIIARLLSGRAIHLIDTVDALQR